MAHFWSNGRGLVASTGKVGVAVHTFRLGCLVPVLTAALLASRADALSITGPTIAKGLLNTLDGSTTTGNNFMQTTSAVSTTLAPSAAPDTLGSFSEFITRYAMIVTGDRQNTTGSTTTNMTSSYSITFTVNNPTGASLKIDIDTLRVGALTSISDSAGNSTISLGAITGQLNTVTQAGLGVAAASQTAPTGTGNANTPFSQAGTTVTILTSAVTSVYVLQFDWTSQVVSAQDGAAIRMGVAGSLGTAADDYPGAVFPRTQTDDGHFVDVKATIIAVVPEPETGALVALGALMLGVRARARSRR